MMTMTMTMTMTMMKLAVVLVGVAAPSVVLAQSTNPCSGLSENKCDKKTECSFISVLNFCADTTGFLSIARQGEDNFASGDFCTTGGGKKNNAGAIKAGGTADSYSVVGGGTRNFSVGDKGVISGGKDNTVSTRGNGPKQFIGSTISGGQFNTIKSGDSLNTGSPFCVITGGGGSTEVDRNDITSASAGTISGGRSNRIGGNGSVVTGGVVNRVFGLSNNSVVTGGNFNSADGRGSVVVGGFLNAVTRSDFSIAFGQNAFVDRLDSSMVVNLSKKDLSADKDGQFLVSAKSYKFQIGNGANDLSTFINKDNIGNLIDALNVD